MPVLRSGNAPGMNTTKAGMKKKDVGLSIDQ